MKQYSDMAAALRNTPAEALREAGYLDRAADMFDALASGQGVSGEVERLSVAMLTARAAFERIRVALINELDEPVRRAFWAAVAARDALDNAMPILSAPAPSCAPGEVERAFRPMETWEERDEAVLLLIDYDDGDHPLDDARFAITIGHNNDHNVGDDEGQGWRFAGWCWSHDHYVEGKGKPVGWMPIPHILARAYASFDGEPAALSPQGLDAKEGDIPQMQRYVVDQGASEALGDMVYSPATPSQRLDAATVERCAQVAEADGAQQQADALMWVRDKMHRTAEGAMAQAKAGPRIARAIRALATEPHQHGGKGA